MLSLICGIHRWYEYDFFGPAFVLQLMRLTPRCLNCDCCFGASNAHCMDLQQNRTQSHLGNRDVLPVCGHSHEGTRS